MRPCGAFIDTNLLVLLVVGSEDRKSIERHRRTRTFTTDDYDCLLDMIEARGSRVFVTPNTLTETSNLLKQPRDARFRDRLRFLIEQSEEIVVASATAAHNSSFVRLGLTDAALLEVVSAERPLITVDLDLFSAAFAKGEESAINFTRFQNLP